MLFTGPLFLFFFLPALLALYFSAPKTARNLLLLAASLLFYGGAEGRFLLILLCSILFNYLGGLAIGNARGTRQRRLLLAATVAINLLLLATFKYATFLASNLNSLLFIFGFKRFPLPVIHLPIGISFYTFMGISYTVDIYRRQIGAERNLNIFALYLSLFPHLIAGPIVRYSDIARELVERRISQPQFAEGIRRFIIGFAKKMIIANTVALPVDSIFRIAPTQLTPGLAWLAIGCYTLQIYFDFSGYSDMAIGLARMFGFHFPENFNYPYAARSITEFWRRWHMTLSTWLRDYIFFPLGVRRPRWRLYFNLLIVFFLCGLWHGAHWHFVIWGLFHGTFLIIERMGLMEWLRRRVKILGHLYAMMVVMIGWVLFRAESMRQALDFLKAMIGRASGTGIEYSVAMYLNTELILAISVGVICAMPVLARVRMWERRIAADIGGARGAAIEVGLRGLRLVTLAILFTASAALSAAGTYNPFIYFRF